MKMEKKKEEGEGNDKDNIRCIVKKEREDENDHHHQNTIILLLSPHCHPQRFLIPLLVAVAIVAVPETTITPNDNRELGVRRRTKVMDDIDVKEEEQGIDVDETSID